ncbi:MAG: hypothetical protein V4671_28005 [Armatimonadota bacterium]
MITITLEEAQEKLPQILEDVKRGIEIIIEQNNITVAKLGPAPATPASIQTIENNEKLRPRFGSAKHRLVYMADDFEAPDFADYM